MIITWCITSVIVFTILVSVSWYFGCYSNYKLGCVSKISFQKFLEIFETSHSKIDLNKGCFYYSPNMYGTSYCFYFSIPDTFRYEHWRKVRLHKLKVREHKLKEDRKKYKMTEIEKAWQKDAEHYKEKQE